MKPKTGRLIWSVLLAAGLSSCHPPEPGPATSSSALAPDLQALDQAKNLEKQLQQAASAQQNAMDAQINGQE